MGDFKEIYACEASAGFSFRVDEITYRFVKHQLIVEDKEEAEALDAFLAKYTVIGNKVKKVDLASAEALVQNHKDTHGGAHSGMFSSSAMAQMEQDKLENRDAQFAKMPEAAKANVVDAMAADGDLILTEKTDSVPPAATASGLIDNTKPVSILKQSKKA